MSKLITILVMAAAPLAAAAAAAHAEQAFIATADLDLARPADAAVFQARVDKAANTLCAETVQGTPGLQVRAACHDAIYEEAVSKLSAAQRERLQVATHLTFAAPKWSVAQR